MLKFRMFIFTLSSLGFRHIFISKWIFKIGLNIVRNKKFIIIIKIVFHKKYRKDLLRKKIINNKR